MSPDPYSFLDMKLPVNGQPAEVLAFRFTSWRKVIRSLNVYFKEFASVQDEVYRQNVRLSQSVNFPFFQYGTPSEASAAAAADDTAKTLDQKSLPAVYHTSDMHPDDEQTCHNFLPYGSNSLADVPAMFLVYHNNQAETAHRASKELLYNIIPRLEDLRRDLLVKIKEIKNLTSDFKNSVAKEQSASHHELAAFNSSIEMLANNSVSISAKGDPYLLKQAVSKQLTRQVNEENYLLEAYLNIQTSGKELERVVAQEVQSALNVFGKIIGQEAMNVETFSSKILGGYVQADPVEEWDHYIKRDPNFVNPNLTLRKIQDISYPNMNSSLAYEIRSGYLERRSKYLKSYSRAWYVLTPTFLHEFKSSDRRKDPLPAMSIPLSDCSLELDKKSSSSNSYKFILNTRISRSHKWVFRAESQEKLRDWYHDLTTLSSIDSPVQRARRYFPSQEPVETVDFKQPPKSSPTEFAPQHGQPQSSQQLGAHHLTISEHGPTSSTSHFRSPSQNKSARNSQILESVDPLDNTPLKVSSRAIASSSPSRTVSPIPRTVSPPQQPAVMLLKTDLTNGNNAQNELVPVQSDVFSETSAATSLGEPYGAGLVDGNGLSVDEVLSRHSHQDHQSHQTQLPAPQGQYDDDEDLERRKINARGRFGSGVLLNQFSKPELEESEGSNAGTHPYRASIEDDSENEKP